MRHPDHSIWRDVWRTVAYLADPASADDLTQETFVRAIGSLPRFTGRSTARTWLLSIARRVVVDQIRYNARRPRPAYVADLDDRRIMDGRSRGFHPDDYLLPMDELEQIAAARVHPSNRG
jgi:RNA polymerase sigma factor (sigma-70 family)